MWWALSVCELSAVLSSSIGRAWGSGEWAKVLSVVLNSTSIRVCFTASGCISQKQYRYQLPLERRSSKESPSLWSDGQSSSDPCLLERQLGWSRVWRHEEPPTAEVSRFHLGGESFLVTSLARVTRSEHGPNTVRNLKSPTIGCLGSRGFPSPVSSVHTRSNLSGWSSRCKGLQRLIGSTDRCQILRYVWYDT